MDKYSCRICGKQFNTLNECIEHEHTCYIEQQKEQERMRKHKEFEERQNRIKAKKEELKIVEDEQLEAYNNYINVCNRKSALQKEIHELKYGKEKFDNIRTLLDIFEL